jgi:TolA-binding protein
VGLRVFRKVFPALLALSLFVCFAVLPVTLFAARTEAGDISLGVIGFDGPISENQARGIASLFAGELSGAGFSVVSGDGLEYDESSTDPIEAAAESGRRAGLRYVLLGSLRELGRPSDIEALSLRLQQGARVTIDLRVIDVETAHTRALLSETGISSNVAPPDKTESGDFDGFGGFDEPEARAILDAVSRLARATSSALGRGSPFIVSSSRSEYGIFPGDFGALKSGALYLVHVLGLTHDADGGIAGKKIPLAVLNVKKVEKGRGVAAVSSPAKPADIIPGDAAELISQKSARGLIFADARPIDIEENLMPEQDESQPGADEEGTPDPDEPAGEGETEGTADKDTLDAQLQEASRGRTRDELLGILSVVGDPGAEPGPTRPADEPLPDPNVSTDTSVIDTYPLYHVERDNIAKGHLAALNLYKQGMFAEAYVAFIDVADAYRGNYLSAYWAGMAAIEMKSSKSALGWFNRALSINPKYQPAIEAKRSIK